MRVSYYIYDETGEMIHVFYEGVIPPIGSEIIVATEQDMQRKTLVRGIVKSIHTEFVSYGTSDSCMVSIVVER